MSATVAFTVLVTLAALTAIVSLAAVLVPRASAGRFVDWLQSGARWAGPLAPAVDRLARDTRASLNLNAPLVIIFAIVGAILAFIVIGAMISPFLGATRGVTENFTGGDTGDATGNTLLGALGPIIPIIAVVVIFGMIIAALTLKD
jgi:hypothetical protein